MRVSRESPACGHEFLPTHVTKQRLVPQPCTKRVGTTVNVGFGRSSGGSRDDCTFNWKAVLLNKAVVGRGYKMAVSNTTLAEPLAGYDSVSVVAL